MKKILSVILVGFFMFMQTPLVFAETFYDFSDEAQAEFDRKEEIEKSKLQQEDIKVIKTEPQLKKAKRKEQVKRTYENDSYVQQTKPLSGTVMVIPKGEKFVALLQSAVNSESLAEDDVIAAVLSEDWTYNGRVIAPKGSVAYGRATDIKKIGYAYANGRMAMEFYEVLTPDGNRIRLTSNKVFYGVEGNRFLKTTKNVAIGAIGGLAVGALFALAGSGNVVNGLAIGSAIGAASGLCYAIASKGEGAEVPAGTYIEIRLVEQAEIVPYD